MPIKGVPAIPTPYVLPKDVPPSPKRPAAEIVRERSLTPAPKSDPRPPTPVEKAQEAKEPEEKETPAREPKSEAPSSPAPANAQIPVPVVVPVPEPQPEDDDSAASTLDVIHMDTFNQILELDEDEDTHDFSQPMVWAYFEQAERTFEEMKSALERKDLEKLSSLGHFLKGSSAALGLSRVQESCEQIQHLGQQRDAENEPLTPADALAQIKKMVHRVQVQYNEAETWLKEFFAED